MIKLLHNNNECDFSASPEDPRPSRLAAAAAATVDYDGVNTEQGASDTIDRWEPARRY